MVMINNNSNKNKSYDSIIHRYGRFEAPLWHPSLGCTLVCPMVLTVVALALTINVYWIQVFEFGMQRRQQADDAIIEGFKNSSEHILRPSRAEDSLLMITL